MNTFPMQDISKASLLKRVIAWEKKVMKYVIPLLVSARSVRTTATAIAELRKIPSRD